MVSVDEVMESLYRFYATDSGILFGLSPEDEPVVRTIVTVALRIAAMEEGVEHGQRD